MTRTLAVLLLLALPDQLVTRDAFLMGTRAQLAVHAPTRAAGLATLDRALGILEATEAELSTWREDSVVSRLNRLPLGASAVAPALACGALREAFAWRRATAGAFDPTLGRPEAFVLEDDTCLVTRRAAATLDVGAFGKGAALDRVEAALGPGPWMIDLGGQVSVGGARADGQPWSIAIAHPVRRDEPIRTVALDAGSLSTSGDSERGAHILDPRAGRRASFRGSVTVWHRRGLAADALSTALYVMGPEAGIAWADERGVAALFLVPERSIVAAIASERWRSAHGD